MAEAAVSSQALREGYEPDDIRVRSVVLVGAATIAGLVLTLIALWGLVAVLAERNQQPPAAALERATVEPPPPRLQPAPRADLAAFCTAEEAILHRWAWIDRAAGVAQIPIEQAMAELARRGWPQPDQPAPVVPPRAGDPRAAAPAAGSAETGKAPPLGPTRREEATTPLRPEGP